MMSDDYSPELRRDRAEVEGLKARVEELTERMTKVEHLALWIVTNCDRIDDDMLRFEMIYRAEQIVGLAYTNQFRAKGARLAAEATYEVSKGTRALENTREMVDKWATLIAKLLTGDATMGTCGLAEPILAASRAIRNADPGREEWTADNVRGALAKLEA